MGRFRSRAELRAIFAKLMQVREAITGQRFGESLEDFQKRRRAEASMGGRPLTAYQKRRGAWQKMNPQREGESHEDYAYRTDRALQAIHANRRDMLRQRQLNKKYADRGLAPPYPEAGLPRQKAVNDPKWSKLNLADWEAKARTLKHERGRFGPVDGPAIFEKDGTLSKVRFTSEEVRTLQAASKANPNLVFSHNHPGGASFSLDDYNFARMINAKEMRAAGEHGYTYSMKRPDGAEGWPDLSFDSKWQYRRLRQQVKNRKAFTSLDEVQKSWDSVHEFWANIPESSAIRYTRTGTQDPARVKTVLDKWAAYFEQKKRPRTVTYSATGTAEQLQKIAFGT